MNKSLKLDIEKIVCEKCNHEPNSKSEVINSLNIISSYNYKTKQYENNCEPVKNEWEIIVSGNEKYLKENSNSIYVSNEGLYFYCPNCITNLNCVK